MDRQNGTGQEGIHEVTALGLMAGTSVDGIDAAIIQSDGHSVTRTGFALTTSYDPATRDAIFRAFDNPDKVDDDLPLRIARDHARAAEMIIAETGIMPALIGFHGQTIYHAPDDGVSVQIGDAPYLSQRLGVPVIHQLRQDDLAHGGQGAPLAPIYHSALIRGLGMKPPAAMVNIGGISNASIVRHGDGDDGEANVIGLDLGPGNALMDDWAMAHLNENHDTDGKLAAAGRCDDAIVRSVMEHEFFKITGPKSLDRKGLYALIDMNVMERLNPTDRMATLAAITAESIVRGITLNCPDIQSITICGGGSLNPSLMKAIAQRADGIRVSRMEDFMLNGLPLDSRFIEAELMAYLAVRSMKALPITFPQTTGVDQPRSGGAYIKPQFK